jgi:hypothetical protein
VEVEEAIRATAVAYGDESLRSLDAIHLATAQLLLSSSTDAFNAFVAYDQRLLSAAAAIGLRAVSPGATSS